MQPASISRPHYVKALEAEGQQVELIKFPPYTTDFTPLLTRAKSLAIPTPCTSGTMATSP